MALNPLMIRNFANSLILSRRFGRTASVKNWNVLAQNSLISSNVCFNRNLIQNRFYAKVKKNHKQPQNQDPQPIEKFTAEALKSVPEKDTLFMLELLMQPQNKSPPLIKEEEAKSVEIPDVDTYFADRIHRTNGGAAHILSLIAKAHDLEKAKQVFAKMQEYNIEASLPLYTMLIDSSRKDMDYAFDILEQIKSAGLVPDLRCYTSVILSCIDASNLDKAFEVVQLMTANGILPDKVVYSTLIDGCRKIKDYDRAWEIFDTSRQFGLVAPDEVMYTSMIHVCAKTGHAERALRLLEEMKFMGLTPTEVTYNAAIYACSKRRDMYRDTLSTFGNMKSDGYAPDFVTLSTVLHAAAVAGDVKSAERIFQEINALEGMKPDEIVYNSLLNAYANCQVHYQGTAHLRDNFTRADEILLLMKQNGVQPSQTSLTQVLAAYTRSIYLHTAVKRYQSLKTEEGLQDDKYVYSHLISMYSRAKALDVCFELYEEMQEKEIEPMYSTICSLIFVAARNKKYKAAMAALRKGVELGYKFTKGNVAPLIGLLKELKLPEYEYEVLTSTGLKEKPIHVRVEEFVAERNRRFALESANSTEAPPQVEGGGNLQIEASSEVNEEELVEVEAMKSQ